MNIGVCPIIADNNPSVLLPLEELGSSTKVNSKSVPGRGYTNLDNRTSPDIPGSPRGARRDPRRDPRRNPDPLPPTNGDGPKSHG